MKIVTICQPCATLPYLKVLDRVGVDKTLAVRLLDHERRCLAKSGKRLVRVEITSHERLQREGEGKGDRERKGREVREERERSSTERERERPLVELCYEPPNDCKSRSTHFSLSLSPKLLATS